MLFCLISKFIPTGEFCQEGFNETHSLINLFIHNNIVRSIGRLKIND